MPPRPGAAPAGGLVDRAKIVAIFNRRGNELIVYDTHRNLHSCLESTTLKSVSIWTNKNKR